MFSMEEDTSEVSAGIVELATGLVEAHLYETTEDMYRDTYKQDMVTDVVKLIRLQMVNVFDDLDEDFVTEICTDVVNNFYGTTLPERSVPSGSEHCYSRATVSGDDLKRKLERLIQTPQPEQRTPEWYQSRYTMITASSAHKVFGSQSKINEIICAKCAPMDMQSGGTRNLNTGNACHWGIKYEPVSVMYYEQLHKTKVTEFGCIPHADYPFIGASPDGIVVDEESSLYGRMLEIKNPYSRVITGIPKDEYWIQMQLQMEVCDMDQCDFLETKFSEYESLEAFNEDGDFTESLSGNKKGIIMFFMNDGTYHYEYAEIGIKYDAFSVWEEEMMDKNQHMSWVTNVYWKLEEVSCVMVARNPLWFQSIVGKMSDVWDTILKERDDDTWKLRLPQPRRKKEPVNKILASSMSPSTPSLIITLDI